MAGFQKAFDTYVADCVKAPTCPLGTDAAQATATFQALTGDRTAPARTATGP